MPYSSDSDIRRAQVAASTTDPVELVKAIAAAQFPGLWEKCYPRVYENVGAFHSPKIAAAAITNSLIACSLTGFQRDAIRNQWAACTLVARHNVPTFFVTKALVKAVNATAVPDDLKWTDVNFPHPGSVFVFERGALAAPEGAPVPFAIIAKAKAGETLAHPVMPGMTRKLPMGAMFMMWADSSVPEFPHCDLVCSEVSETRINSMHRTERWDVREIIDEFEVPLSGAEKEFNMFLTVLLLKLIIVMGAKPELLTTGSLVKRVKPKRLGGQPTEFWSPNILGRGYQPPTEGGAGSDTGHGAKKRLHWRRGHFTHQPYGEGRLLRKLLWREPVLVGHVLEA